MERIVGSLARARLAVVSALLLGQALAQAEAGSQPTPSSPLEKGTGLVVYADADDDDNDGLADREASRLAGKAWQQLLHLKPSPELGRLLGIEGDAARLLSGGRPVEGKAALGKELAVQGIRV